MRRATGDVLKYQYNLVLRLNGIIQLRNIGMIQPLHQAYLSAYRLLPLNVLNLLLLINFQRHRPIVLAMHPKPDNCIGTLANLLA